MITIDDLLKEGRLLPDYDPDQHLEAMHGLIGKLRGWQRECDERVKRSMDDWYVDACVTGTYADAACSHAAVGALAPFFEGVFRHEFGFLSLICAGRRPHPTPCPHARCLWVSDQSFWNPEKHNDPVKRAPSKRPNIRQGALELLDACGLLALLPRQFPHVLEALISYRNNSLHGGYEWIKGDRHTFRKTVQDKGWQGWFTWAESSGEPWMAYMTDTLIDECLSMANHLLDVFEDFRQGEIDKLPSEPTKDGVSDLLKKYAQDDHSLDELRQFLRRRRTS